MVSDVWLSCKNKAGTALQQYLLSPGAKVTHQMQKENILASIPFSGFLGIDMGLISQNLVTVTGQMFYDHNTRSPLLVLEEIQNIAAYQDTTKSGNTVIDGKWVIIVGSTIQYEGIPYLITYDISSGEGDIINYTIQLSVST